MTDIRENFGRRHNDPHVYETWQNPVIKKIWFYLCVVVIRVHEKFVYIFYSSQILPVPSKVIYYACYILYCYPFYLYDVYVNGNDDDHQASQKKRNIDFLISDLQINWVVNCMKETKRKEETSIHHKNHQSYLTIGIEWLLLGFMCCVYVWNCDEKFRFKSDLMPVCSFQKSCHWNFELYSNEYYSRILLTS